MFRSGRDAFAGVPAVAQLHPNIFIPQLRLGGDEVAHQLDARRILADFHGYTLRADVFLGALEGYVFADDDARDFVKERRAAAHGTGGKGGVEGAALVNRGFSATGVFQAVHFRVMNCAAFLDSLVVAAADDFAVAHEHGTDWDAASRQAFLCLFNRCFEKWIHARFKQRYHSTFNIFLVGVT